MKRNFKRLLCIFLVTLIVIQILPLTVFANEYQNDLTLQSISETETPYENLEIEEEIVEERDEFSKTYLLENGVYCTLTSSTAIHEESNNEWVEINSSNDLPETINEASIALSSVLDDSSDNSSEPMLNDGLVVKDNDNNLDIYGAELVEDENGDYVWNITSGIGTIREFSYVLMKPETTNVSASYDKTQVTVDASIKLTCNTQLSENSYDTYVRAFDSNWSDDSFSTDELLETDEDFTLIHAGSQIYDYNSIDEAGNYVWNITSLFNKWENGSMENNGLVIQTEGTESVYITSGMLIRYYRIIDKNDYGFTYHSEDMGRAGVLNVNDFTNVPILERNELSLDGMKMPVSLTRYISNGTSDDSFGAGGKWNYSSELTYSNNTFVWNTTDGSSKRFQKSSENETDEDGREKWVEYLYNGGECVLWVKPSTLNNLPYNFSQNIIVDEEENIYRFNSSNKLISITSKDNVSLSINYGNGEKISSITDGMGRKYVFDNTGFVAPYNTVKKIALVDSNNSSITYDSENPIDIDYSYIVKNNKVCLSSATYPDGKTVYYEYDNYGRLITVKNIDNSKLVIEYYNSDASKNLNPLYFSRIKSYTKSVYDSSNETYVVEKKVEFNSNDSYRRTIQTTENGKTITEISQYNTNLDLLYLTDSNGNEFYADYDNLHALQSFTDNENISENLVINGDMHLKKPGGKIPRNWDTINLNNTSCSMPVRNDDYCVEFVNSIDQTRGLYQNVSVEGKKDDKYVISAWGKATSTIPKDSRFWGVRILAQNAEGTKEIIHEMEFDTSLWGVEQIRKTAFALPFDTSELTVQLISCNQLYTVEFDDIELYKAEDSYVSVVDDTSNTDYCVCSNCSETNCPCKCENESACNCITCKRGINTNTDSNGNEVTTRTDGISSMISTNAFSSSANYLASSTDENGVTTYYVYNENNGTLTSFATGNESNSINYTYNAVGLLKNVSQTVTNIMTGADVNMVSSYTYDGDTLTQINHNGSVYSFDYDIYGNVSNVKIGNQSLATYSYADSNRLGYLLYGNGDRINYTYDANGNITSVSTQKGNEETDALIEYTYTYDSNGKLLSYTDNVNGTITNYTDNGYTVIIPANDETSTDTVVYSTDYNDETDEETVSLFGYTFTKKENEDVYDVETGQTTSSSKYTLPCDTLGITGTGESITVSDYYGRNISSKFKLNTDDIIESSDININQYDYILSNDYTYVTSESNITTNLVESYTSSIILQYNLSNEEKAEIESSLENGETTQEEIDEIYDSLKHTVYSLKTSYEYDDSGRITRIYLNDEISALYEYDEAGQLTQEISEAGAIRYTYNSGGNITSKVYYDNIEYNEENNEFILGEPTKTISYTYDNSEWTDLLTNYNGINIQYDSIGNPLNYQGIDYLGNTINATLEWDGRLLKTLTYPSDEDGNPGQKYEYSYNADGLRTEKRRYMWNSNISEYELYQIGEYIWEGGYIKGYRISYPGLKDSTTGAYSMFIVLPLYDENMEVMGISYKLIMSDGSTSDSEVAPENVLYFTKDAQGNIVSMYNAIEDYEMVYKYDAYGQMLSLSIPKEEERIANMPGNTFLEQLSKALAAAGLIALYSVFKEINPFTYRGYLYDGESGLYYNQSRYYSPEWGRFINADDPMLTNTGTGTTNANNMFAYCENDPVNKKDPTGYINYNTVFSVSGIISAVLSAIEMISIAAFKNTPWGRLVSAFIIAASVASTVASYASALKSARNYYGKNSTNYKNLIKYNSIILAAQVAFIIICDRLGKSLMKKYSLTVAYCLIKARTITIVGMSINVAELLSGKSIIYRSRRY